MSRTFRTPSRSCHDLRRGATLVEVIVSALVLGVIAIAGASFIYLSRIDLFVQQYRRAAIECANTRMETLMRRWDYTNLAAHVGASPMVDTVSLNGRTNYTTMTTTVSNGPDACLDITVSVKYRAGAGGSVVLETLRSK